MPDQLFPVSFSLGLDEKTDPKAIPLGKLLVLENGVFTKPGLLEKRNGLDLLGKTINPTGSAIVNGEALASFQNQLLMFNGTRAFSYIEADEQWIDKGRISSVINREYQIIRNGNEQRNPDAATVSHFECYAFEDSSGGVRYSVIDSQTGNFLVSNKLLSLYGSKPKVLFLNATEELSAQFVIIFVQGTVIKFARLFTSSLLAAPFIYGTTGVLHENQAFDACVSQCLETVNGEVYQEFNNIFIAYAARRNAGYVYATPKLVKVTPETWLHYSTFADITTAAAPSLISICPTSDMSSEVVALDGPTAIVLFYSSTFQVAKVPYYIGELLPLSVATPANFDTSTLTKINVVVSETPLVDQIQMKVLFQFTASAALLTYIKIADLSVEVNGEAVAVSSFSNIKIKRNVGLYSKAFLNGDTVYFGATHESNLQSTYFVLNADLETVTKFNQDNGGGLRSSGLSEMMLDGYSYSIPVANYFTGYSEKIIQLLPKGNGIYKFPTQKKGKLDSEENTVFSKLGIVTSVLDFKSLNHFISAPLNDNLYTVGGILQNYDGNSFTEAGFNLYPEGQGTSHGASLASTQFVIITRTPGSPIVEQETDITCIAGNRIKPQDVIQVNSGGNANNYVIWFKVDGQGSDPGIPGCIPLEVPINSYYSSAEVCTAMANVLALTGDFLAPHFLNVIFLVNTDVGSTVPPAAISAGIGNIAPGTYNYLAIWKYIDNQGRIHRSTTSIPETIVVSDVDSSVSVTFPLLDLTTKQSVILEVYRTENLGSLYRRVSSVIYPTFVIHSENYRYKNVTFIDTLSDAEMLSNELVYTTGDVLDNSSPPACSLITTFDNRLWIAGLEDKNLLQYSKIIDPLDRDGIGGFSDALAIAFTPQGGDIIALARMDDKLIVLKRNEIYYISGTGPSNANDGNNYNPPQLVSTDVGCDNPNSVVLMPNGIMFHTEKGIYLLNRGMQVSYVGSPVEEHNDLIISSAVLAKSKNQVRLTTEDGVCLVYDYARDQWTTFTNWTSTDADLFNGNYVVLASNGQVRRENKTFIDDGDKPIVLAFETGNLSFANVQGYQRFKRLTILGEFKGGHTLKVSFAFNFSPVFTESTSFDMNTTFTDPNASGVFSNYAFGSVGPYGESDGYVFGGAYEPYQVKVFPTLQKCTSFRIRVEDDQVGSEQINEGYNISNMNMVVGIKTGANKIPSTKSKGTS